MYVGWTRWPENVHFYANYVLYKRVTLKIKDKNFHKTTLSSIHSKTFLLYIQLCKNCVDLELCLCQKIYVNVIKTVHRRNIFSKKRVSQEILANIGLRKKSVLKFPNFESGDCYLYILYTILPMLEWSLRLSYNIFIYTCIIKIS